MMSSYLKASRRESKRWRVAWSAFKAKFRSAQRYLGVDTRHRLGAAGRGSDGFGPRGRVDAHDALSSRELSYSFSQHAGFERKPGVVRAVQVDFEPESVLVDFHGSL